jgi:hypothetical protein
MVALLFVTDVGARLARPPVLMQLPCQREEERKPFWTKGLRIAGLARRGPPRNNGNPAG